jgi:hypothetical protein
MRTCEGNNSSYQLGSSALAWWGAVQLTFIMN